jgi:hypothetical protein
MKIVLQEANMTRVLLIILFLVGLIADGKAQGNHRSENNPPEPALKLMKRLFPSGSVSSWRRGDLDNDGIDDIAMIINQSDDHDSDGQILVLHGDARGDFELLAKSLVFPSLYGTALTYGLDIRKGSLILNASGPEGYESVQSTRFQFKWTSGDLRLIGYSRFIEEMGNDGKRQFSVNYLTGDRAEWSRRGKKYVEFKSKIAGKALLGFESFDWNSSDDDNWWAIGPDFKIKKTPNVN